MSNCSRLIVLSILRGLLAKGDQYLTIFIWKDNIDQYLLDTQRRTHSYLSTLLHSSTGIATCSTISSPNPSSAGMCIGVFESRRMRWMPRSDKICPPSPMARKIRPVRACEPSRARSS